MIQTHSTGAAGALAGAGTSTPDQADPGHAGPVYRDEFQAMYTPISSILRKRLVTVSPETVLRSALETMDRQRIGSVIVVDPATQKPLGIFTLQDVLRRVVLPALDLDKPITEVMSRNLVTVKQQALAYDAALLMARKGLRHILVVNDEQQLVGVVSKNDLFDLQRSGVRDITQEICDAPDLATLQALTRRVRDMGAGMIAQGMAAGPLTYFLSSLNDLLTIRVIEQTAQQFDLPAANWCWLAFGSEGRFEQTFSTDQDNGLIFSAADEREADELRKIFLPFCQAVNQKLDACGFTLCKGNIMAGNPEWCLSLDEWRMKFGQWVRTPSPTALLNATIFFDFRPLHGDQSLAESLCEWLFDLTRSNPLFLHMMAQNALDVEPPIGMIREFVTEGDELHQGMIDLKKNGVRIFVDAARIMSLASGVWQTNTAYRLRHAANKSGMNEEEVGAIVQAMFFIQRLRLRNQQREMQEGAEPTNYVTPDQMNELDRRILKESFKQAKRLQQRLKMDYRS